MEHKVRDRKCVGEVEDRKCVGEVEDRKCVGKLKTGSVWEKAGETGCVQHQGE